MEDSILTRLQNWYKTNCDGDWEHSWGLSIGTIDNPGWSVKIHLEDTCLSNLVYKYSTDNGTFDWIDIKVKDQTFEAYCSPEKLIEVLKIFLDEIIPKYADPNFHYVVYIPLTGGPATVWRPAKAKMLTDGILEIVEFPELKYEDIKVKTLDDITFKREDIFSYRTNYSIGDQLQTELKEMYNGINIIVKE